MDHERDKDDPLYWQMRQETDEFLRRQRWWWAHYQNSTLKNKRQIESQQLSHQAEQVVDALIRQMGYRTQTTTHKCPFDLWVQDEAGRAVKVEVKISRFHRLKKGGGRYQCDVRHHDQADLLVFIARNGQDWPFVIPMNHIEPRRNIAIWSFHPEAYGGQWARYLEAWEHLHQAIEAAAERPWQLRLL
ncbi:MAG: hypothetical protein KDJ65_08270 [Anaerolineae bacterium]|nr:hypothetical protein [Anaerolineae bacterium]